MISKFKKIFLGITIFACSFLLYQTKYEASTRCDYESTNLNVDTAEGKNVVTNFLKNFSIKFEAVDLASIINPSYGDIFYGLTSSLYDDAELRDIYTKISLEGTDAYLTAKIDVYYPQISKTISYDIPTDFYKSRTIELKDGCPDYLGVTIEYTNRDYQYKISFNPLSSILSKPSYYKEVYPAQLFDGILLEPFEERLTFYLKNKTKEDEQKENETVDKCIKNAFDKTEVGINAINTIFDKVPSSIKDNLEKADASDLESKLNANWKKFAYFDKCSLSDSYDSILRDIDIDIANLEAFKGAFDACISKESMKTSNIKFENYSYKELENLITILKDDTLNSLDAVKDVCGQSDVDNFGKEVAPQCAEWRQRKENQTYEECLEENEKEIITNLSCSNIADYANNGTASFSEYEKKYTSLINDLSEVYMKRCSNNTNIRQCIINECENSKKTDANLKKLIDDIDTTMQNKEKKYNDLISVVNKRMVDISNIKTDADICDFLWGDKGVSGYIHGAMSLIRIGGILLTLILSIMDGIKAFASFKDDENRKFFDHLKIRLICIALLLIIPTIIDFVVNLIGNSCGNQKL